METFFRLEKYDPFLGLAIGVATCEEPDRDNEMLDYFGSKPYFQKWSASVHKDSSGKSFGNVRFQHDDKRPVGHLESIEFDDAAKAIRVAAKINEPIAKQMLHDGDLTGFSIGGAYVSKTPMGNGLTRYIANPSEISVVDRPCAPSATFSIKTATGGELRKHFKPVFVPRQVPGESWLQKSNREYAHQQAVARGCFMKRQVPASPRVNPNVSRANDVMTFTDLSNATPADLASTGHHTISAGSAGAFTGRH